MLMETNGSPLQTAVNGFRPNSPGQCRVPPSQLAWSVRVQRTQQEFLQTSQTLCALGTQVSVNSALPVSRRIRILPGDTYGLIVWVKITGDFGDSEGK